MVGVKGNEPTSCDGRSRSPQSCSDTLSVVAQAD